MEWTNIRILWPKLKIMKPYLPRSVFSQIERVFRKPSPTREQLSKIARLGENVGLQRNEIVAAIDAPLPNQGIPGEGRTSIFIPLILVSILVVVSFLLIWAIVDPRSFPIHTYTPGTFYGTIRPQDFESEYYSTNFLGGY
ncbi:MAG: hypothetical protein E4H14_11395 [Candidatus Thorarchaeota archaeon]|nr:MAG: hypothetical protein E4H14_11395 [Candidatus Thorarchaeota archaeon]